MRIGICGAGFEGKAQFLENLTEKWPGFQPMPFVLDPFKHGSLRFFRDLQAFSFWHERRPYYTRAHRRHKNFLTTATLYDLYAEERASGYMGGDTDIWWAKCLAKYSYDHLFYLRSQSLCVEVDAELVRILQFFRVPSNVLEGTMDDCLEQFSFVMGIRLRTDQELYKEDSDDPPTE